MLRHIVTTLLLLWLALPVSLALATPDPEVYSERLDNGLTLIVKPDHRAPVAVSQLWYRVGASDEYSGVTGLSHLLEHMMFKGTSTHPEGEFSAIVARNGGRENAFTGPDYTAYYELLAADRLPIAFTLEADRMRNLLLQQDAFIREREVVMEERRLRTDDEPTSLTYEHFMATAYLNGPYGNPVIGWMGDIAALTLDDLKAWYRQWYAPNNAILVVVGDVRPKAISALVREAFGSIEPSPLPQQKPRREVEQRGERRIKVHAPALVPYLIFGYKVPTLGTAEAEWEPYALQVLAEILDGDNSARLARHLVRGQEIAASAGAGYRLAARLDGLFLFDGVPAPDHTVVELEQALLAEIAAVQQTPVDPQALARVKTQVIAGEVYERDSIQHQAIQLGLYETLGLGWAVTEAYPERIRAVTAAQVQAVAQRYLIPQRRTVAELVPGPLLTATQTATTTAASE